MHRCDTGKVVVRTDETKPTIWDRYVCPTPLPHTWQRRRRRRGGSAPNQPSSARTTDAALRGPPSAPTGGRVQTFAATDLEGFTPKSESESETLGCLLTTFRPLVWPGFLSPAPPASASGGPSFPAALLALGAAFLLARISTMDGWLSETELGL